MSNSNKHGISAKDVYDKLYARMENDNTLFWNRIPFYITIFGLCATGYGYSVFKLLGISNAYKLDNLQILFTNGICLMITLIGFVVALFWVIISKGSRYWFEKYLEKVYHYERPDEDNIIYDKKTNRVMHADNNKPLDNKARTLLLNIFRENDKIIPYNFSLSKSIEDRKIDNNIFSPKAGSYSMGKAQILMGQLMMGLWSVIFIIHGVNILTDDALYNLLENIVNINQRDFILIFSGIIIFIKILLMFKTSLAKVKKALVKIKKALTKSKASHLKSKELIAKSKKSFTKIKTSVLKKEGLFVKLKEAFRRMKESLIQLKASPLKRKELIVKSKKLFIKIKTSLSTMEKLLVKIDELVAIIKKLIIKAIEVLIKIIEVLINIKFFAKMKLFINKNLLAIISAICIAIYIMHVKWIGAMLLCFLILELITYIIVNALETDGMNSHEKIRNDLYKK